MNNNIDNFLQFSNTLNTSSKTSILNNTRIPNSSFTTEQRPGYVIITTSSIKSKSLNLTDFINHKKSLGYNVSVITENNFGAAEGKSRALNIRKWLVNHYQSWNIHYVLLIGNPDPDEEGVSDSYGDIPMMMCWPRRGFGSYEEAPTDYFYADLTGDWDSDGDGYYGEFGMGASPEDSGVDFQAEVHVGRIPIYDEDIDALDNILNNITAHHDTNRPEKYKILELMAMGNYKNEDNESIDRTDGLDLPQYLYENILSNKYIEDTVMHERAGLNPVPTNAFHYDMPLNHSNFIKMFNQGYGAVLWWAHGSAKSAWRKYWRFDDGDNIPETISPNEMEWKEFINESIVMNDLKKNASSFFFLASCLNGQPEIKDNLGAILLKTGAAISTISASRVSYYAVGTWNPNIPYYYSDNAGLGYYYLMTLINDELSSGEALSWLKYYGGESGNSYSWMNKMVFNLYGDPQLSYWKEGRYEPPTQPNPVIQLAIKKAIKSSYENAIENAFKNALSSRLQNKPKTELTLIDLIIQYLPVIISFSSGSYLIIIYYLFFRSKEFPKKSKNKIN
ncbi:MAG: C25 family cysteine peptidase [Promethearchaeota archaeon]